MNSAGLKIFVSVFWVHIRMNSAGYIYLGVELLDHREE